MLALPPLDLSSKEITPPSEPSTPPLAVMLAAAAVVLSMKANVVLASPAPKPPPMTKVALSAVAVLSNKMKPPCSPLVLPPTVVKVPTPALENPRTQSRNQTPRPRRYSYPSYAQRCCCPQTEQMLRCSGSGWRCRHLSCQGMR